MIGSAAVLALAVAAAPSVSGSGEWPSNWTLPFRTSYAPLQDRLNAILDRPILKGALVTAIVMKEDGTVLFARNPDVRAVPASNQKLLSVAYALHSLGPTWKPRTRFWRLEDRIVVDSPGDPSMTHANLKLAAAKLKPATLVSVKQGYAPGVPPTWENDDLPHRYAPRITAFTVDRGAFTLANDGGSPKLTPEGYGVRIIHFPGGPIRTEFNPFGNLMVVRGDFPNQKANLENFAIPEPDRAAASLLGGYLMAATSLPDRNPDFEWDGDPVSKLAKDCLVPSDNYLAECLLLLTARQAGPLGENPYATAPNRMREFLVRAVGLSRDEVRPMDGSGMSRHNLVTARGIAKLLNWSLKQATATLWLDSLAKPGTGTLSGRLSGSAFLGKTGTLNSVSGLSGYVNGPNGERLIVSLLMNHFIGAATEARGAQDDFIREIEKPAVLTHEPVSVGAVFGGRMRYAGDIALPKHRASHGDRVS